MLKYEYEDIIDIPKDKVKLVIENAIKIFNPFFVFDTVVGEKK